MKLMKRNLRPVWVVNPGSDTTSAVDENGWETGELTTSMSKAIKLMANVAPASGVNYAEVFGKIERFDRVLMFEDYNAPITLDTLLFIEKSPEFVDGQPVPDYKVIEVSKSLNILAVGVRKVTVS